MLKTLSTKSTKPKKGRVGVGGGNRAGRDKSELDGNKIDGNKVEDNEVRKKVQKTSKSKNSSKSKRLSKSKETLGSDFFTPKAKPTFTELRQAFLKASILYHFDPERHIRIETDISGCAIGGVFS